MVNAPPFAQMQAQFNSLLDAGWAPKCLLTRVSGAVNAAGHLSGSTVILASGERMWIQPLAGRSSVGTMGFNSETTHVGFQKLTGAVLRSKDRVLPSGATYVYDVIASEATETHRMSQLKQDLRK